MIALFIALSIACLLACFVGGHLQAFRQGVQALVRRQND